MTDITQNETLPAETQTIAQNAEAAKSENPLSDAIAQAVGVQTSSESSAPLIRNDNVAPSCEKFSESTVLHNFISKAIAELKNTGLYVERQLEHIEQIFKSHI